MLNKSVKYMKLVALSYVFFSMAHADDYVADQATKVNGVVRANQIIPLNGAKGTTQLVGHVILGKSLQVNGRTSFLNNVGAPSLNVSGQTTLQGNVVASHIRSVDATLGEAVMVLSDGTLGVVAVPSSESLKQDICEMGSVSKKIMNLNPVMFTYKNDPTQTKQFGLMAEQVDALFPKSGLVVRSEDGKPSAIRYHLLTPLLLNEYQQQQKQIDALLDRVNKLEQKK